VDATDFLIRKSNEYAQLAAHLSEKAELTGDGSDTRTALGYTLIAIALREVAGALMEAEELTA
jgi:hypothetical protein